MGLSCQQPANFKVSRQKKRKKTFNDSAVGSITFTAPDVLFFYGQAQQLKSYFQFFFLDFLLCRSYTNILA